MAKKTEDKEKHLTEEIDRVAVIDAKDDGAKAVKRLLKSLAGAGSPLSPRHSQRQSPRAFRLRRAIRSCVTSLRGRLPNGLKKRAKFSST